MLRVLPMRAMLLGRQSYENMEIGDGEKASREYFRVTFTEDNKDKAKVRKLLEECCGLDTLAVVKLMDKLHKSINI